MDRSVRNDSLWMATSSAPERPAVGGADRYDAVVVGAGITGLTTALLLKNAGKRVAVVEMGRVGQGVTGFTTAKVTSLHQLVYAQLVDQLGEERARVYGAANEAAIAQVAELVETYNIDCAFERRPAATWTVQEHSIQAVRREAEVAARLGLPARMTEHVDLPFGVSAAVAFDDQAQLHPRDYVLGLAAAVDGDGSAVFEHSRAVRVHDGAPCRVAVQSRPADGPQHAATLEADDVVIATQLPFADAGGFFAKAHPKRSYVLALQVDGPLPQVMSISAESPSRSVRSYERDGTRYLLVAGESHRPGVSNDERVHWQNLEGWARQHFAVQSVDYRWSAHDYMSVDGMPYVGRLTPVSRHTWTATGFRKWGLSNGTAAAAILTGLVTAGDHPWAAAFDAQRPTIRASARAFLEENVGVGVHFVKDRFGLPGRDAVDRLEDGDGVVARLEGADYAVSRDGDQLRSVSPVCTHLGCQVAWNRAERSWDCPCHGSRYDGEGTVVQGPATRDLKSKPLPGA